MSHRNVSFLCFICNNQIKRSSVDISHCHFFFYMICSLYDCSCKEFSSNYVPLNSLMFNVIVESMMDPRSSQTKFGICDATSLTRRFKE